MAAALMIVSCGKKETKVVDLKAESEAMVQQAEKELLTAKTPEDQMEIATRLIDNAYALLEENMGAPYSDSLFIDIFKVISKERQQTLIDKMPEEMKQSPKIAELIKAFEQAKAISAGNPFIDFTAVSPKGKEIALSELVGKTDYVLVDFWASWCGPCRRLIPVLKELYSSMPEGKLQIFSCSVDQEEAAWLKALKEEEMPWPQAREDEKHVCSELYDVQYIPYTILIDREGQIVAINPTEPELEEILLGK